MKENMDAFKKLTNLLPITDRFGKNKFIPVVFRYFLE